MSLAFGINQQNHIRTKNCLDYNNCEHLTYLTIRFMGIEIIKNMTSFFLIEKTTMYKAIHYLDTICFKMKSIEQYDIISLSKVCFILSVKFNEVNSFYSINELIKVIEIKNYQIKELQCLDLLDYSLGDETPYDHISSLINNEFRFNSRIILENVVEKSLMFLNELIEDIRFLDFSAKETAISIIKISTQILSMPLSIAKGYQLKYNNLCLLVFNTIILDTNLIVFIPKQSLYPFEYTKQRISRISSENNSHSTADSNYY